MLCFYFLHWRIGVLTRLSKGAFSRCSNLTSITIGNGIASIGWNAFSYNNLQYNEYDNAYYLGNYSNPYVVLVTAKSTHITTCIISENTKIIYESAFSDCDNLTSITIPDSVINIGSSSFDGCDNLTSVTIEDNVVSIDRTTFSGCYNLKYNEYDNAYYLGNENNPYVALITTKENITSCTINDNTKIICDKAFASSELTDIIIPDGVTSIGNYTFQWCDNLTSVTIGNGITSIGSFAFDGCGSLTSVTIPNSVTSIGSFAFAYCYSLTNIVIPDSVTSIEDYAFDACGSLTSIIIPDSVTSIGESAFLDCYSLSDITFNGTRAEWNNIKKGEDWNSGINNRVVHCTDGDIKSN